MLRSHDRVLIKIKQRRAKSCDNNSDEKKIVFDV